MDEKTRSYHEKLLNIICSDITIMTPIIILEKYLIKPPRMYVENMILPWIQKNVHIVTTFSKMDVWKK